MFLAGSTTRGGNTIKRSSYTKWTLEMDPGYAPVLLDLGTAYLRTGDYTNAIAQFEKARTLQADNGVVLSDLGQAYALAGKRAEALGILKQLHQASKPKFVSSWDLSLLHIALGERAKAVELLRKATDEHAGWVVRLGIDPALDDLRDEPQFQKLKQRVRIPQRLLTVVRRSCGFKVFGTCIIMRT